MNAETAKEVAKASLKTFICDKCSTKVQKAHIQFGEVIKCKCGGTMSEKSLS